MSQTHLNLFNPQPSRNTHNSPQPAQSVEERAFFSQARPMDVDDSKTPLVKRERDDDEKSPRPSKKRDAESVALLQSKLEVQNSKSGFQYDISNNLAPLSHMCSFLTRDESIKLSKASKNYLKIVQLHRTSIHELTAENFESELTNKDLQHIVNQHPNLKTLVIENFHELNKESLLILAQLKHVEKIIFEDCFIDIENENNYSRFLSILDNIPSLKCFHINYVEKTENELLEVLIQSPKLANIHISDFNTLSEASIRLLGDMPSLKKLSIHSGISEGDKLLVLTGKLKQLEELNLINCQRQLPLVSFTVIGTFQNLKKLKIEFDINSYKPPGERDAPSLLMEGVLTHLSNLNELEEFELVEFNHIGNAGLAGLARLPKLKKLSLIGCDGFKNRDIVFFMGNQTLEALDLSYCPWVDAGTIDCIVRLEKLKDLTLPLLNSIEDGFGSVNSLTPASLEKLRHLPELRKLNLQAQTAYLYGQLNDHMLTEIAKLTHLTHFAISGVDTYSNEEMLHLVRELKNLQSLEIIDVPLSEEILIEIANLKSLIYLDISQTSVENSFLHLIPQLPKLKSLILNTFNIISDEGIAALERCPSLEKLELEIDPHANITHKSTVSIGKIKKLKSLKFDNVPIPWEVATFLKDKNSFQIDSNVKRVLNYLSHWTDQPQNDQIAEIGVPDVEMQPAPELNNNIESISAGPEFTDIEFASLIQAIPNLKILNLTRCTNLTAAAFALLPQLESLEELNLSDTNIQDSTLTVLAKLDHLKKLSVASCKLLTDRGSKDLSKSKSIEDLDISECIELTPKSLGYIAAIKTLKKLSKSDISTFSYLDNTSDNDKFNERIRRRLLANELY